MSSHFIMFIPNFVKMGHLFQLLKLETHRHHGDLRSLRTSYYERKWIQIAMQNLIYLTFQKRSEFTADDLYLC